MNIMELKGMSFDTYEELREYVLGQNKPKERVQKRVGLAYPAFEGYFKDVFEGLETIREVSEVVNFDLIVFSGGQDIDPRIYGRTNTFSYGSSKERDTIEVAMFHEAMKQGKKLFGACRGHQLLAALSGGSLLQDIAQEGEGRYGYHPNSHKLEFQTPIGVIYRYFKDVSVTSLHHQGVAETNLRVTSYYKGLPESCESRNIITTQFHPEFMDKKIVKPFFDFLQWEW